MPAERKIYGDSYYSVKKNTVTYCRQCGKKIPIITPAYAKGNKNSAEIYCRECVITLYDHYQYEQFGRIPFPETSPLYVDFLGHSCLLLDESNFITKIAIFRHNRKSAYLPVSYCTQCRRLFVDRQNFEHNRAILSHYHLISTITDKPVPGSRGWGIECASPTKEIPEYPPSVIWAYLHPFQGGGCSGK